MELEPVRHTIIHRHRECIVMAKGGIRQMDLRVRSGEGVRHQNGGYSDARCFLAFLTANLP